MNELQYTHSIDAAIIFKNSEGHNEFVGSFDPAVCRIIDFFNSGKIFVALIRTTENEYIRLKLIYGEDIWRR